MRLNRYLASCGLGSRRSCESLITGGRVSIDGVICTDLSRRVGEGENVSVNGKQARPTRTRTVLLHKPPGHICSRSDPHRRPTIYDLLPPNGTELAHVGRLDFDSEGLILLTNDGVLSASVAHPSKGVEKEYLIGIDKAFDPAHLEEMIEGFEIEPGLAKIESGTRLSARQLQLVLKQGLKRQIRLMLEKLGYRVKRLTRTRIGPLEIGDLRPGRWRELSTQEVKALRDEAAGRGPKRRPPKRPTDPSKPKRKPRFPRKKTSRGDNADHHDQDRRSRAKRGRKGGKPKRGRR